MSKRLEDYALIGDGHTAALVGADGAIDWLCLPRFDSSACFASLLGTEENGHWTIAPHAPVLGVRRRYRRGTLILETEMSTADGAVRVIDFMPHRHGNPTLIRIVEGISGQVSMEMTLRLRFDYGRSVPWVRSTETGINAVAGPNTVTVAAPVPLRGETCTPQRGSPLPRVSASRSCSPGTARQSPRPTPAMPRRDFAELRPNGSPGATEPSPTAPSAMQSWAPWSR